MKKHLHFFEWIVSLFGEHHNLYVLFLIVAPLLLLLSLGLLLQALDDGTIQKVWRNFIKNLSHSIITFRRRKLRPAATYLKHQLATIRTLF